MKMFIMHPPPWSILYRAHAADYTPHALDNPEEGAMNGNEEGAIGNGEFCSFDSFDE
ncbi:MAG TPA: hypothetical protein VKO18_21190 [Terriglobia bacterium]|nr:hypothetical protein [Terriglobia bacterium]